MNGRPINRESNSIRARPPARLSTIKRDKSEDDDDEEEP